MKEGQGKRVQGSVSYIMRGGVSIVVKRWLRNTVLFCPPKHMPQKQGCGMQH